MDDYTTIDLRAEIGHALDNYTESSGIGFDLDYDGESNAIITATAQDGSIARFSVTLHRLDASN